MIRIGTSGWLYPPWRGVFYPEGLPRKRELEYLAGLSVKGGRFITHLKRLREALVVADTADRFVRLEAVTSDFVYVRLHGEEELYVSGYTDESLDRWADEVRAWSEHGDVFVHFDNDAKMMAPRDAIALANRLRDA